MDQRRTQEVFLSDLSLEVLDKLSTYVHRSVVFVDDKFAEILHWHGGVSFLLNSGATNIKDFSSFENGERSDHSGAFFISSPLINETLNVLQDIISYSNFENVTVITNVHPMMQAVVNFKHPTEEAALGIISNIEMQINQLMREKADREVSCSSRVIYIPIVTASILPNLFILPTHSYLFPLLPTDINNLLARHKLSSQLELSFEHLPRELQLKFKLLVSSLDSMAEVMNLSEEIFAIGTTSNIIAGELSALPWARARKKLSNRKASLLLIDRTLDVGNVSHHSFESVLDRILDALPRLHQHSSDIGIDMLPVCNVASNMDFTNVAPGCLAHPGDHKHSSLLNALALLKQKEITSEINRRLVEVLDRENLFEKSNFSGTFELMQHHISLFKNQPMIIKKHSALLQLSLAVLQGLHSNKSHAIDKLTAIEKMVLQSLNEKNDDESQNDKNMVLKVLEEFELSFGPTGRMEDLLKLLMYTFAINDQADQSLAPHEENILEEKLIKLFMGARQSGSSHVAKLVEKFTTEVECRLVVQDFIHKLKGISASKFHLQRFKHAVDQGSVTSPASHQPIIKQIIQNVLDPSKPDLVDINHQSTTFGDLVKSGFGFFRGPAKLRPGDNPLIVLFVIGGVTASEVKMVKDVVSRSKFQTSVLIGGTTILARDDVLNLAMLQDNL